MSAYSDEEWRAIPGYEGLYEASSLGRVRSLDRMVASKAGSRRLVRGQVRSASFDGDGYLKLELSNEGRKATYFVHRLVAAAFIGPMPEGLQTRHLDGNKLNNTPANLAYGTCLENAHDKRRHGTTGAKSHCHQGHPFAGDNLYISPKGRRECRTCKTRLSSRYWHNVTKAKAS